tara:strand:- start:444 stop:1682 length:1239 start_codon:yes stop_codon:yes gene_type:complete
MQSKLKKPSFYYFTASLSIIIGLVLQDFYKIPLTGGIIVLGLIWIGTFTYKKNIKSLSKNPIALVFIAFYLLHLGSLIYTTNNAVAYNDLELKVTLLLLPLFMLSKSLFSQQNKILLLHIFAVSMACMAIYDLYYSFLEYQMSNHVSVFYYKNLPHLLVGKPHYLAWYYSFAMFIALRELLLIKKQKLVWTLTFVVLLISLILLSSRAYLFAFILVIMASYIVWLGKNKNSLFKLFIPLATIISVLLIIPNTRSRITDTFVEINKLFDKNDHRQTNPRVYIWKYATTLIAEKPLLGYGVGDAKDELEKALKNCEAVFWDGNKNVPLNKKSLNFHNQFLQSWAEIGVLGFLLLLFILIRPFFLKNQHPLFLIFIGLTFVGFLTESMLERQAGVVMFAFMYPLLASLKCDQSSQ